MFLSRNGSQILACKNSHRKKKDASRGDVSGILYEGYKNNWLKRTMSATHAPGQREQTEETILHGDHIIPGPGRTAPPPYSNSILLYQNHLEFLKEIQLPGIYCRSTNLESLGNRLQRRILTNIFGDLGSPCGWAGKESACNEGDPDLIPRLVGSPGERKGYPLQYSGLENSMDYIVHGVAKSQMTEWLPLSLGELYWH